VIQPRPFFASCRFRNSEVAAGPLATTSDKSISGDFFETSATIQVSVTTKKSTGHGFRFVSSTTTKVNFAQIGRETNGVFF
jgi:hypothetical protein